MSDTMLVFASLLFLSCSSGIFARLQLVKQSWPFHQAENWCKAHHGHLVSIHNDTENQQVYQLCHLAGKNCWIGYEKQGSNFRWTDGTSSTYSHFISGEPDNWHGVEGCAVMKVDSNYHGQWSDQACDASYGHSYFVCRLPSGGSSGGTHTGTHTTKGHGTHTTKVHGGGLHTTAHIGVTNGSRLAIQGSHFVYGGQRLFLSGVNKAWESYAYDFGNNQYQYRRNGYIKAFQTVQQAGGNSMRIWVHLEGETSPQFDSSGHVTGTDKTNSLISDLHTLLQDAKAHNVFVFLCLWNAAVKQNYHYRLDGLIKDTDKLQSYLDNALMPMVKGLKDEPALGGWDIMNEPGGEMIQDIYNSDPCYDTRVLHNSGAGWAGKLYSAQEIQRFVNWQADAIKKADPSALVTLGVWNGKADEDSFGFRNYYKDTCLIKSGGKQMGTLSFYQIHSYSWQGKFGTESPFLHNFTELGLDKPLVIGEFRESDGGGMTINQLYDHAYFNGYAGGWGWSLTDGNAASLAQGMQHVRGYHDQTKGGNVAIHF